MNCAVQCLGSNKSTEGYNSTTAQPSWQVPLRNGMEGRYNAFVKFSDLQSPFKIVGERISLDNQSTKAT